MSCRPWTKSVPRKCRTRPSLYMGRLAMDEINLSEIYRGYIACLNTKDWSKLGCFVDDNVNYNGQPIGLSGNREILKKDFRQTPDLYFEIQLLVCEPPHIASRLHFDCTPLG